MMAFARSGVLFNDGGNLAIAGVRPSGLAAQGHVIWSKGQWALLSSTSTPATDMFLPGTTPGIDTTGADLLVVVTIANNTANAVSGVDDTLSGVSTGNVWGHLTAWVGNPQVHILWSKPTAVGPNHAFHVVRAVLTAHYPNTCVAAFSGSGTSQPDQFTYGAANAATTTITPSRSNTLVVTGIVANATSTGVNAPFTVIQISPVVALLSMGCGMAYYVQDQPAALTPTWTGPSPFLCAAASFNP